MKFRILLRSFNNELIQIALEKVRATLLTKHAEIEKRDKIRKLRELKKMGKQIQVENEKKKAKLKRMSTRAKNSL